MSEKLLFNKPWIMQRADPYVYLHTDGSYYFTASVPEYDRIVLRKADSLGTLAQAEEKTIQELKSIMKPFVVLVNSVKPYSEETLQLVESIKEIEDADKPIE